jgi:hypothetical protein
MYGLQLERPGPRANLDQIEQKLDTYISSLRDERARRSSLTREQRLAERLNFAYSREPGEAWHYEGNNWNGSEHKRWLGKARILLERFDTDEEIEAFLRTANEVTR